jgi:hypothetical protein
VTIASAALDGFKSEAKKMVVALVDMERAFVPPQHFIRLVQRRYSLSPPLPKNMFCSIWFQILMLYSIWFQIITCLALVKCLQICVQLLESKNLLGVIPISVLHHLLRKMLLQLCHC